MKNIYVAPMAEQINIQTEGVVAVSLPADDSETNAIDTSVSGNQLSQKRGWSSDLWNSEEE